MDSLTNVRYSLNSRHVRIHDNFTVYVLRQMRKLSIRKK